MRELGIDYVQGYHVGRPQPLEQALGALQQPSGA
jgi:EAL domain-containing protein (putative c-di-GMP-specific phosphodiesterase class I)